MCIFSIHVNTSAVMGDYGTYLYWDYSLPQIREDVPKKASKADVLGFVGNAKTVQVALALESGR